MAGGSMFDLDDDEQETFDEDDEALANVGEQMEEEAKEVSQELTDAQKKRAEKNRLKALTLKKSRLLSSHPYNGQTRKDITKEKKLVDTGGGFFLDDEDEEENLKDDLKQLESVPPPLMPPDQPECEDCGKEFAKSYLFTTFDHSVCDNCKNMERDGPHELITKTDAKKEFLIKDTDFEKGERGDTDLKFIVRKNPHNPRWGDMKLFLRLQVEKRALLVWGSEEALEAQHAAREEAKEALKVKKYDKKMKELRRAVRSSLFTKDLSTHTHKFGEEEYVEAKDEYKKTCQECGHEVTYEKM